MTSGSIHAFCDREKAVHKITGTTYKGITDHLEHDNDLLQEARPLYKNFIVKISIQWVEGHSSGGNLAAAQELNQYAPTLAYSY